MEFVDRYEDLRQRSLALSALRRDLDKEVIDSAKRFGKFMLSLRADKSMAYWSYEERGMLEAALMEVSGSGDLDEWVSFSEYELDDSRIDFGDSTESEVVLHFWNGDWETEFRVPVLWIKDEESFKKLIRDATAAKRRELRAKIKSRDDERKRKRDERERVQYEKLRKKFEPSA